MNKLTMYLLIALSLANASCGKDPESTTTTKNTDRLAIAPDCILQKTNEEYYIVARYDKDYTETDQLTLTVDDKAGVLETQETRLLEGTKLLFKLPASNKTGDLLIKFSINNGQKTVETEQKLRFVAEYDLSTVWKALDRDYYHQVSGVGIRQKQEGFTWSAFPTFDPPQLETSYHSLGTYFLQDAPYYPALPRAFIMGLSGVYHLSFENSLPKQLRVLHGDKLVNQLYSSIQTKAEIESIPGIENVSAEEVHNGLIYTYRSGELVLKLHDTDREVYTIVNKE